MTISSLSHDKKSAAEHAAAAYRLLLLMRRFEEKAGQLYALGLIPEEIKLCIGREALITGLIAARREQDLLIFGPRCHSALLALGIAPNVVMSELANPKLGLFQPHPQSQSADHIRPKGFYRSVQGSDQRALWALSLALAASKTQNPSVVFVMLDGDAGVSDTLYRAVATAKRFALPIIFTVDHAVPDPVPNCGNRPTDELQAKLSNSAVEFAPVDGISLDFVVAACLSAAERTRSGAGPQGLLVSTQAFRGHARQPATQRCASTPQLYDPVQLAKKRLLETVAGGGEAADAIESDIRATMSAIGQAIRAGEQV